MSDALITNGRSDSVPDSPAIDSPATPVDSTPAVDVKIDVQLTDHEESDVRHDPFPVKLDDASTVPQVSTPIEPSVIPIEPPKGTPPPDQGDLLEDVKMAEEPLPPVQPVVVDDVHMAEPGEHPQSEQEPQPQQNSRFPDQADSPNPPSVPAVSPAVESLAAEASPYHNINSNNDDIQPPPAKRARMHSDPDQASLANTATPPPVTPSPPPPPPAPAPAAAAPSPPLNGKTPAVRTGPPISPAQFRFCLSTIRSLKRMKAAGPFLYPVDPVALNVPHYPSVIKHPMDFSTVERKLNSSNPAKPDPNPVNPRYRSADEFVADVRLIFSNCLTFNGPEHPISAAGKQVEEVFDRQMKNLPPPEEAKPPVVKKQQTPPPPPPPQQTPAKKLRRPSTSVPVIRRTDEVANGRPKREIHPPPPKDLPYEAPKKIRKIKESKSSLVAEQLKFCEKVLKDLHKKSHYNCAYPFYEPVDWVKLDIPSYPKIVKKPMDLSTMRKKLEGNEYTNAEQFHDDFKLMISNCMKFNPAGTPVNVCGQELNRLFYEKWKNLPQPRSNGMSDDEEEEEEEEADDNDRDRMIRDMEAQMEAMNRTLAGLKQQKVQKPPKHKEKREKPAPVASTSKAPPKVNGKKAAGSGHPKKTTKRPVTDDDVLSFEQKKQLSDTIGQLDGAKLERVIQIIHEGVPEIRDSTEEIELEIDTLPASVLTKLYNFVIRPTRQPPAKRGRTGKGTGTGGLKRKSMDEDVEAEKIRLLEERMALFEGAAATSSAAPRGSISAVARGEESDHSSDSSSDESSGSDSE